MELVAHKRRLVWVGRHAMPDDLSVAISARWNIIYCPGGEHLGRQLDHAGVVVMAMEDPAARGGWTLQETIERVNASQSIAVILVPGHLLDGEGFASRGQCILADLHAPPGEIVARIETAAALQPAIKCLREDVAATRSFGAGIAQSLGQLDEEMRLAARLQQDFLPRSLPQIGPARFATLFRPASWVSGDIYDVFRLDETHLGFYVADVVGHGMPAALLTMFIKKALQTKRITGKKYQIIPPDEALALLNADICQQNFTSCQFCTAFYAVLDTQTLTLSYARGGHPAPLLLSSDQSTRRLEADGPLLGVFPDEAYQLEHISLRPGDRVIVFSDGAEEVFSQGPAGADCPALNAQVQKLRKLPPEEMMLRLTAAIEERCVADGRRDDVTILVMDVLAAVA